MKIDHKMGKVKVTLRVRPVGCEYCRPGKEVRYPQDPEQRTSKRAYLLLLGILTAVESDVSTTTVVLQYTTVLKTSHWSFGCQMDMEGPFPIVRFQLLLKICQGQRKDTEGKFPLFVSKFSNLFLSKCQLQDIGFQVQLITFVLVTFSSNKQ